MFNNLVASVITQSNYYVIQKGVKNKILALVTNGMGAKSCEENSASGYDLQGRKTTGSEFSYYGRCHACTQKPNATPIWIICLKTQEQTYELNIPTANSFHLKFSICISLKQSLVSVLWCVMLMLNIIRGQRQCAGNS